MEKIKLFSRKNQVYLIVDEERAYVQKIFGNEIKDQNKIKHQNKAKYQNEVLYRRLLEEKGINVPKLFGYLDEVYINYEYIDGKLLSLELLEGREQSFVNMGEALYYLHKSFAKDGNTLIAGDVNLRNFIALEDKIFFLDYEEYRKGEAHEDVSTFLSHLVSHREVKSLTRLEMGKVFLNSYYKGLVYPPNLEADIIFKAKRLANWRGFGELEDEIIDLVKEVIR